MQITDAIIEKSVLAHKAIIVNYVAAILTCKYVKTTQRISTVLCHVEKAEQIADEIFNKYENKLKELSETKSFASAIGFLYQKVTEWCNNYIKDVNFDA
jgi:hypothetical protein